MHPIHEQLLGGLPVAYVHLLAQEQQRFQFADTFPPENVLSMLVSSPGSSCSDIWHGWPVGSAAAGQRLLIPLQGKSVIADVNASGTSQAS